MKSVQTSSTVVVPAGRKCPRCGGALGGFGPEGLCGACLLDGGLGKDDPAPEVEPMSSGPRRFGDYELIEEIARGGMGVVFKARQISLNRIVAVKMILSGQLAGAADVQRFRREAEAAAHLHHSNIVAIHEVGECDDQHYFSMDYVEGRSLSAMVRDGPLPAPQAARYVEKIARAVHYAHEQGVLHRDLKPSNVLLDAHDEPHVTDFGLAKRLNSEFETRNPELTLSGQALGTPAFMPPEQATGQRDQMGPRSDVYSLGAILYHLITGRPPFVGPDAHATLAQVIGAEAVAPRLLNPSVPRDLETIALKCLSKESSRRYASALALAEDLQRHHNHQPILALPPSAIYRARKFVRRHWVGVTVAASFVLLMASATAVSTVFGIRAERARARSELTTRFMVEMLAGVAPSMARTNDTKLLRAIFQKTAKRLDAGELQRQPLVEAELRTTLGKVYRTLGNEDLAVPMLQTAYEIYRRELGEAHLTAVTAMGPLAGAYHNTDRSTQAVLLYAKALEIQTRVLGATNPDTLRSMADLARAQLQQSKSAVAETQLVQCVELHTRVLGAEAENTLRAKDTLARYYMAHGRAVEAEAVLTNILAARKRTSLPDHPSNLRNLSSLARTFFIQGKYRQAQELWTKTLEAQQSVLGADHRETLLTTIDLAGAQVALHELLEAERLVTNTLALIQSDKKSNPSLLLSALKKLAVVYNAQGKKAETETLFVRYLDLQKQVHGPEHYDTLMTMYNLAASYVARLNFSDAEPLLLAVYDGLKKPGRSLSPKEAALLADARHHLAQLYDAWDKPADAAKWHEKK